MDSTPGSVVKDAVRVSNLSDAPLSFQVYGADAYNTPRDGALAYRQAGEAQTGIGDWITLGTNALVIPPGRAADIPFTVNVPADVTPGSHVGGIVALNNAVEQAGGTSGVDVGIQRAIAVRIQLTVEGPVTPGLAVRSVHVRHRPSAMPFGGARVTLTYTVVNTGNAALRPAAAPQMQGLFGLRHSSFAERTLPLLLPGQSAEFSADWPDAPGLDQLTATVRVSAPGMPPTYAQSGRVAVSWPTLGVVITLLAVIALALGWIRRTRPAPAGETS
ncbi:WxL protein peptidoglycan domain-containing protein [Streptomyces sp. NPDC002104]